MGRTYQKSRLFLGLSVEDNLYLAVLGTRKGHLRLHRRAVDRELRERARELAAEVGLAPKLETLVGSISHGEQRQLEVGMARAVDPKLMLLDEPASGLSRGERVALTDMLLELDPDITLVLIEHDMDVALRVAETVTMMHDGEKIVEGTPEEIRSNQLVHDLYLGGRVGDDKEHAMSAPAAGGGEPDIPRSDADVVVSELAPDDESLLEISDLDAFYGPAHVLQSVSFTMRDEPVAIIGRNGMGKTTLCNAIMQIRPATTRGSIRFRGEECVGRPSYKIAASGIGYVPQGRRLFESLSVDEHLRMIASARRPLDPRRGLRALPSPRPAPQERRDAALRRRAADAGHRPRAAHQSTAAGHGRALRRPRPGNHRVAHRDVPTPERRGAGDPGRRAEPGRGHGPGGAPARDGGRAHIH